MEESLRGFLLDESTGKPTHFMRAIKSGLCLRSDGHVSAKTYLHEYVERAGLASDTKGALFRTAIGRTGELSDRPLSQPDAYRMIRRRALSAGIATKIGNHSFRATGKTTHLSNGGKLEIAQAMANHESTRTTGLYDRRSDKVNLGEIERIVI